MFAFPDDPATRYAIRVETGEVVAGPYVRAACTRHLKDLVQGHERGLTWHIDRVEEVLLFFRQELTIEVEEEDEFGDIVSVAKPFVPHESQEFILGSLFGWYRNGIRRFRRCYIELGKGNGKPIALDTPVLTADGWRRFGDLRVGDYVLRENGDPIRVIAETPVMLDEPSYKLVFSCGETIIAGAGHLWRTEVDGQQSIRTTLRIAETIGSVHFVDKDRKILSCDPVEPVPMKCITIDHPDGMFLIGEHLIPTHNSPLAAGIGHYMMCAMKKLRAEIYSAATDKDQAAILFRDAVEMYRRSPALSKHLVPSGHNPVWQLAYPATSSYFKPISSEKKGKSGIRPFCALIDEVHEHPNNEVIEMLRAGTKGNQSALIFEITNSGNSRDSVCWDEHEYTVKVLQGEEENDGWFGLISALDSEDDPFLDESCWIKANPLLGVSIFPEFIREQVNEARGMPSKEALVRRLHFCQWTEGSEGWITRDVWMKTEADLSLDAYEGHRAFGGLDLSYTKDLTAFALAFPVGGSQEEPELDVFCWFWKPQEGLAEAIRDDRVPYDVWAREGHLNLTAGRVIKLEPVAQFIAELSDRFDIRAIAYDNYRHRELEDNMLDLGIELPMVEHPQGFRRVENSRLWMPNSVQDLENGIIETRFRFKANPLLRYNVAQAVVREDPAGTDNRIFDKKKSRARIDGIVACAMAVGAAVAREEPVFSVSLAALMED